MNVNALNKVASGEIIYDVNQEIKYFSILLKGRVEVSNLSSKIILGSGAFLGITEEEYYRNKYKAIDDCVLYVFDMEIEQILQKNKDYKGVMVNSISKYLINLYNINLKIKEYILLLNSKLIDYKDVYYDLTNEKLDMNISDVEFEDNDFDIEYYLELSNLPIDLLKNFYSYTSKLPIRFYENAKFYILDFIEENNYLIESLQSKFYQLINENKTGVFDKISIAVSHEYDTIKRPIYIAKLDEMIQFINNILKFLTENTNIHVSVDSNYLENLYFELMNGSHFVDKGIEKEFLISELDDSLSRILLFSELDNNFVNRFKENIDKFMLVKDKFSTDDNVRVLRKEITDDFYVLYKAIFLKSLNADISKPIELFLNFGYVSEKLISKIQLENLCNLQIEKEDNIYTAYEWLKRIYNLEETPSKTELDVDYFRALKSDLSHNRITAEQEQADRVSNIKRLEFEIENMFRYAHRAVSGKLLTFIPILVEEVMLTNLKTTYINKSKLKREISKIKEIDYGVFYRECIISYDNTREIIQKEVTPNFIILPTFGSKALLWQELENRKSDSRARVLLPMFHETDFEDMLINVCGVFRFELVKTMQAGYWNDIKELSLTSEYNDYIQFYKKNSELSPDKKEKLKEQIKKYRNIRDIFAYDYMVWIKYESKGSSRLNKVVRRIMATYCPFNIDIRKNLANQFVYQEAFKKFEINKRIKIKELESKLKKGDILQEIQDTYNYYLLN